MSVRTLLIVLLGVSAACSRSDSSTKKPASKAARPSAAEMVGKPSADDGASAKPKGGKAKTAAVAPDADAGREKRKIIEDVELKTEEAETNPFSQDVTLKLSVTPQVRTLVTWGAKVMARLEPGKMEAEISRPRGSGPLDLEFKAEGFMPYHARLYTDRNDRISVRLYRPEEAPNLFGYNRSPEGKDESAEKREGTERPAKPEKADRAVKPEKADKAAKPARPERSDKPTKAK
jgi:hypothetical protein